MSRIEMHDFEIIELYHGGTDRIEVPNVKFGRSDLDFGQGFYLTDIYSQADIWARKRAKKRHNTPLINKYLFNRKDFFLNDKYKTLMFASYNDEWLDFIVENRLGHEKWREYDFIEGGVADDRVVDQYIRFIDCEELY